MRKSAAETWIIIALLFTTALLAASMSVGKTREMVHAANSSVAAQANSWSGVAPMPTHRWQFGVAVVNGKIYAVGGMANSNGPVMLNTTEEFDPATNTWNTGQSMPFPSMPASRFQVGAAGYNGKVYVIGGTNYAQNPPSTTAVEAYDPQTNSWETKTPLPINASEGPSVLCANTVNDKIYVMGNTVTSIFNEAYDPAADTWSAKSLPLTGEMGSMSAVIDNKIYVLGGEVNGSTNATLYQVYDTATNTWSVATPLPTWVTFGAAAATTGAEAPKRIYVLGSQIGVYSGSFVYDPAADSWMAFAPMPSSVTSFEVANVNDQLFVLGGYIPPLIAGYPNQTLVYTPFGYGGAPIPTPRPPPTPTPTPSTTPTPSASPAPTTPPTIEWTKTYSPAGRSIIQTQDGGYAIGGSTNLQQGTTCYFFKTDSSGNIQWNTTLGDMNGVVASTVQTSDGVYALTGTYSGTIFLVKLDASGNMILNKTYTGMGDDMVNRVFPTSDGGNVLAGTMNAYTGAHLPSYAWLLKTDSDGNVVWSQTYGSGNLLAATQTSDGGYAFLAPSPVGGLLLAKVDASGQMEWNQTYSEVGDFGYSLAQASDGGYAMATSSFWLAETDWLGNMQWNRTYFGPGNDTTGWSFIRTSDGGYAMVGNTNLNSSAPDAADVRIWVLKIDSDGNPQWNQTYGGPNSAEGYGIIQTNDGGYAIVGDTYSRVDTNWQSYTYLVKLAWSTQPLTSPTLYVVAVVVAAIVIAVVVVVVVLRRKTKT